MAYDIYVNSKSIWFAPLVEAELTDVQTSKGSTEWRQVGEEL